MKSPVHFYRFGETGLILVWRAGAVPGALLVATSGSFEPDTLVAELPAERRFALIPGSAGVLPRFYWRAGAAEHGAASFTGQPPAEDAIGIDWEPCSMARRAHADVGVNAGPASRNGLRTLCRPETGGQSGALEWTDAAPLAPPHIAPGLKVFFTFKHSIPARDRRRGGDIHGDLQVRVVPNAGLEKPVRIWIDRLHPQDLTPEPMSAYIWDGCGWAASPTSEGTIPRGSLPATEWTVLPDKDLFLKIPRLSEAPTLFRPARHAVDERDVMIVRTWPEVEVQTLIVSPRLDDSAPDRPPPFLVPAVEFLAGDLVNPEPTRPLLATMQQHWEQHREELTRTMTPDDWGNFPAEVRLFLDAYQRWLPHWPPERLAAVLCDERIFPTLAPIPPGIGARLVEEASASAQEMAAAAGAADADARLTAYFENPGLFHAVADEPEFARTLAQTTAAAPPPRPFTAVRWLTERLPADPRLGVALSAVSGKSALHYLAALAANVPVEAIVELLCTGFVPASCEEVAPAGTLLERFRLAIDLSFPDVDPALVAEAPQTSAIRALRQMFNRGGYTLAELEKWVSAAQAAHGKLAAWCLATERERGRRQLLSEIGAVLRPVLPLPDTVDAAAWPQALESAMAAAPTLPEATGELGECVAAGSRRLAALLETWREREHATRGAETDDGLERFLELFGTHLTTLAYLEVAASAKDNLYADLARLAAHEPILGADAIAEFTPLVEQAHAHFSDAPPAFSDLPVLQAALHAKLESILPLATDVHAAAARLLPAVTALAGAVPGMWQAPPFKNAEQFATDFAAQRPALQAELERVLAQTQERERAQDALARILQPDAPPLPEAVLLAWPRPEAGTGEWANALAACAETLPARLAAAAKMEKALCSQIETSRWSHAESVVGALQAGRCVEALEIARQAPLRARVEAACYEAARLLAPSGDAPTLLTLTPPLIVEGEDAGWFRRARDLLGELAPQTDAAALESRLAALTALRAEILEHDAKKPLPCRSILLGAARTRCRQAHERLTREAATLTPEAQALLQMHFERWSAADLQTAEKYVP